MISAFWLALLHSGVLLAAPVSEQMFLNLGANEVYLEISGPSSNAPLLIFLHGGPGSVPHLVTFQSNVGRQLEQEFLVVYLHQRGTGKSSSVPDSQLTSAGHVADLVKVVDYLKERYDQDKVHLVGHSWGGMLAGLYAEGHSENIEKLVLIATTMNVKSMLRDSYEGALKWAQEEDIPEAVAELTGLEQPFETRGDFFTVLGWADKAGGVAEDFDMDALVETYSIDTNYPNWREQQSNINGAMVEQLLEIDLDSAISSLDTPALFISGALDTIIPETTMRRDYDSYGGEKTFVLLEESHHLPFIDQPDALAQAIKTFLSE